MRLERTVKNAVMYGIIGIDLESQKECLGLYLSNEPESARYWLSVINELKNHGIRKILIFAETILPVFLKQYKVLFLSQKSRDVLLIRSFPETCPMEGAERYCNGKTSNKVVAENPELGFNLLPIYNSV